jgi:hypothetical protein
MRRTQTHPFADHVVVHIYILVQRGWHTEAKKKVWNFTWTFRSHEIAFSNSLKSVLPVDRHVFKRRNDEKPDTSFCRSSCRAHSYLCNVNGIQRQKKIIMKLHWNFQITWNCILQFAQIRLSRRPINTWTAVRSETSNEGEAMDKVLWILQCPFSFF